MTHSQTPIRILLLLALLGATVLPAIPAVADGRPNILFIAIDDLNDWASYLGGHPNGETPNIDRLAESGVAFEKAYCAAPACGPSRAALMTGISPHVSGVYHNSHDWRLNPLLSKRRTIPQYFADHGYLTMGSGKIFHGPHHHPESFQEYFPEGKKQRPSEPKARPPKELRGGKAAKGHFDWGPLDVEAARMSDMLVVDYVVGKLQQEHEQPFFLACGIFRPHLPWFVPQKYFDMFPLDEIELPKVLPDDLDDLPEEGRKMALNNDDHERVTKHNEWKKAVQGYLASSRFADDCIGRVMEALESSPHAGNTIVVLWSDHGWHLGEKQHWRKFSLWEESARVNLIFAGPGIPEGERRDKVAGLIDIFPTLLDLAGLPEYEGLSGVSLKKMMADKSVFRGGPVLTTNGYKNHSLRGLNWRYIRYANGGEELYDHREDPMEWKNLVGDPAHAETLKRFRKSLPENDALDHKNNYQ